MNPLVKEHIARQVIITNAGVNGHNTSDLLQRMGSDVLSAHPQLVVLMVGTNDMLSPEKRIPVELFEKNYQKLITEIKKHSELILMTSPPVNTDYIFLRQDRKRYDDSGPEGLVRSANNIIKRLAVENSCPVIDIYAILQACGGSGTDKNSLFQNEANTGNTDGVHPTANGYRVIATAVYQAIKLLFPEVWNIVCFGDSITFGYQMQGQGTTEGDSYPAVLKRMMDLS